MLHQSSCTYLLYCCYRHHSVFLGRHDLFSCSSIKVSAWKFLAVLSDLSQQNAASIERYLTLGKKHHIKYTCATEDLHWNTKSSTHLWRSAGRRIKDVSLYNTHCMHASSWVYCLTGIYIYKQCYKIASFYIINVCFKAMLNPCMF